MSCGFLELVIFDGVLGISSSELEEILCVVDVVVEVEVEVEVLLVVVLVVVFELVSVTVDELSAVDDVLLPTSISILTPPQKLSSSFEVRGVFEELFGVLELVVSLSLLLLQATKQVMQRHKITRTANIFFIDDLPYVRKICLIHVNIIS